MTARFRSRPVSLLEGRPQRGGLARAVLIGHSMISSRGCVGLVVFRNVAQVDGVARGDNGIGVDPPRPYLPPLDHDTRFIDRGPACSGDPRSLEERDRSLARTGQQLRVVHGVDPLYGGHARIHQSEILSTRQRQRHRQR